MTSDSQIRKSLLLVSALGFLIIYLSGFIIVSLIHQEQHVFGQHLHLECEFEAENDPCHQRIYHHNQVKGCDHEEHVHAPVSDCKLCDAILSPQFSQPHKKVVNIVHVSCSEIEQPIISTSVVRYSLAKHKRGPPHLDFSV
jgi:hypothetical protein